VGALGGAPGRRVRPAPYNPASDTTLRVRPDSTPPVAPPSAAPPIQDKR
jgi:hypothetical protein